MRLHRVVASLFAVVILAASSAAHSTTGTWSSTTTRLLPVYPFDAYGLREHAAVYDPKRDRVLVFGGQDQHVTGIYDPYKFELWAFELISGSNPYWHRIDTCNLGSSGCPSGRSRPSLIYDALQDRILVFGGFYPSGLQGRLWELRFNDPAGWDSLNLGSGGPAPSTTDIDVRAVHDTARRRLLVISPNEGVFAVGLDGGAWSTVFSGPLTGYIGGYGYSAVYDSNSDRLLIFGGRKTDASNLCANEYGSNAVYALSLESPSSWQQIASGGPSPYSEAAATFDRDANRVLLYGGEKCGQSAEGRQLDPSVWELSLNGASPPYTWQVVQSSGPLPLSRFAHSATLTLRREIYVFGGTSNGSTNFATTYKFVPTDPPIPESRARHVTVYDPRGQRMILWGGDDGFRAFKDVWAMSLLPGASPSWTKLTVSGTPPVATRGAAAAYDTRRGVMYVQGGNSLGNPYGPVSDFYQLSFPTPTTAAWSVPNQTGTAGNRMFHSMAYDSTGDHLYIFGGWDGYDSLNTTVEMTPEGNGVQWAQVATTPNPGKRYGHTSFFDSVYRRLVIMGGEGNPYGGGSVAPVWGLSVTGIPTWATIYSFGGPGNLWFASAAFRNYGARAYITGGWFNPVNVWSNQPIWSYWLFDDPQWQSGWGSYLFTGAPSNHIYQHTSIYDRLGNRVIRFGGSVFAGMQQTHPYDTAPTNVMNLSYALATPDWMYDSVWSQIALYGVAAGGGGGGGSPHPKKYVTDSFNTPISTPSRIVVRGGMGSASLRFRIEGSRENAPLRVQIFDVRGRLVRTLQSTESDITWDRLDRTGVGVSPGIYVYRAVAGTLSSKGKLLLTR